eukprot:1160758-Pelagomonas_calceolata.AAC.12
MLQCMYAVNSTCMMLAVLLREGGLCGRVCLNVDQAMGELLQRGLASTCPSAEPALEGGQAPIREEAQGSIPGMEGVSSGEQRFQAVDPRVAQQVLEKQWDSILWQHVHSTLGRVEALSDEEAEGGRERDRRSTSETAKRTAAEGTFMYLVDSCKK